jgi:hypothetical protein
LRERFVEEGPDLLIEPLLWYRIICLRVFWNFPRYRAGFRFPFVATAVKNFHFLMAKQTEGPKRVTRPPVRLVAVENASGVRRNAVTIAKPRKFFR